MTTRERKVMRGKTIHKSSDERKDTRKHELATTGAEYSKPSFAGRINSGRTTKSAKSDNGRNALVRQRRIGLLASHHIPRGISQRELNRLWLSAGGQVVGGDHLRYRAPDGTISRPYHCARRDASVTLLRFVRQYFDREHIEWTI